MSASMAVRAALRGGGIRVHCLLHTRRIRHHLGNSQKAAVRESWSNPVCFALHCTTFHPPTPPTPQQPTTTTTTGNGRRRSWPRPRRRRLSLRAPTAAPSGRPDALPAQPRPISTPHRRGGHQRSSHQRSRRQRGSSTIIEPSAEAGSSMDQCRLCVGCASSCCVAVEVSLHLLLDGAWHGARGRGRRERGRQGQDLQGAEEGGPAGEGVRGVRPALHLAQEVGEGGCVLFVWKQAMRGVRLGFMSSSTRSIRPLQHLSPGVGRGEVLLGPLP